MALEKIWINGDTSYRELWMRQEWAFSIEALETHIQFDCAEVTRQM